MKAKLHHGTGAYTVSRKGGEGMFTLTHPVQYTLYTPVFVRLKLKLPDVDSYLHYIMYIHVLDQIIYPLLVYRCLTIYVFLNSIFPSYNKS